MKAKLCQILLDHGNEILLLVDAATLEICSANAAAARHLGYPRNELIGRSITDIECSLTDVFFWEDVRQGTTPEVHDAEASYLRADGELLTATKTISRPAAYPEWLVICAVPTGRLRRTEDELADTGARLRATLEATADGILLVDRNGAIVNMNRRVSDLWRIPDSILLTHNDAAVFDFMASCMRDPEDYRRRMERIQPDAEDETSDVLVLASGRILERNSRPARQGKLIIGRVFSFTDITELKEHQQQLERMAHYDALTGIPNRVLLGDRLQQAIAQSRRHQRGLAVVYLDIDGFKEVNDAHGHETGDQLLVCIAQRLHDALREGDTLARLGGDEFVAVLTDIDSRHECEAVLSRLLLAAATPLKVRQHEVQLSASLGVTLFPHDGSDPDTLLRHADQAMYQAKQTGKNRYHLFDPEEDRQTQAQRRSIGDIEQALERGEFELYYQPKVNMRTGAVVGAEALIRWRHRERGLVPPGEFLPLIEGNDLLVRVGEWVLDSALRQMTAWRAEGLDLAVSVNIAAYHLQQKDFLSRLRKILSTHDTVPPEKLELEVVESAALEGIAQISHLIEGCRALGVQFSLDDFGTGYSSLTYLRRLPASVLKIDQSFVRDMLWDSEDLAIVEGVIGLAAAFRRVVIAEGVETAEHGELLLRLGCDLAQGYGIARPMPASELPGWIAHWRPDPAWTSSRNMSATRDDLPITYAEVDHRNWVKCLEDYLSGTDASPPPLGTDQCRFVSWYVGEGHEHYARFDEFQCIRAMHEAVHELGRELVAQRQAGNAEAAIRRLPELRALHNELIGQLHALSAALVRERA